MAFLKEQIDEDRAGREMYELMQRLYPICRSITGEGFRSTQAILRELVPQLTLQAVPSGTRAFDWVVPQEWNVRDAYVKGPDGEKVIDFHACNLHLVNYSVPVRARMPLAELKKHLFTIPEWPEFIPYRTSYYKPMWGFCLAHEQFERLPDGEYEVVVDTTLTDGELNYGECYLPGETQDEVLFTAHACHPSLCNDNLSGVVILTHLARLLAEAPRRYSYRILFLPGGIGSVVWLSRNQDRARRIKHGLVLSCLGDEGGFTYKRTRRGDAPIDRAAIGVLRQSGSPFDVIDFSPYGYDERNFCSPRFNLPVGSLTRSTHSEFRGYHSSGDDFSLISPERLAESLTVYASVCDVLEHDRRYVNLIPDAEPQLGRRGLYGMMGGLQKRQDIEIALLWVMNYSDGEHGLLEIAERSQLPFEVVCEAASLLLEHDLLREAACAEIPAE